MCYSPLSPGGSLATSARIGEVKQSVQKPVLVTVQAKPLYVDGMHAGRGRRQTLPFEEFVQALDAVRSSGADGVTVFTWSDLLRQALAEK